MSKPKTNRLNRALQPLCKSLKKPSFWLRLLRDLAVLLLIGFAIASYQQRHMLTGKAPALDGTTIEGAIFQGAIFQDTIIQRKNVFSKQNSEKEPSAKLVYFFGTWCPVCRFTSPAVDAIAQDYPSIGVALSSGTDQQIADFMVQNTHQFDVLNDDLDPSNLDSSNLDSSDLDSNDLDINHNGKISQAWGVHAVPAFYILDSQNNIVFVTSGASSQWGLRLRLWWASL
jgi:thiol-disulfide isomerase/thioredoxin